MDFHRSAIYPTFYSQFLSRGGEPPSSSLHQLHLFFAKATFSLRWKFSNRLVNFSQSSSFNKRTLYASHAPTISCLLWGQNGVFSSLCAVISFLTPLNFPHTPQLADWSTHFNDVTAFSKYFDFSKRLFFLVYLLFVSNSGPNPIFPPLRGHSYSAQLISPVSQHSSPDSSAWFSSARAMPQQGNSALLCYAQTSRVLSWSLC